MSRTGQQLTPAMRQFHRFKQQHPGCVLFFRMGDFYEMFYDDAKLAHKVLGVTLTQRTEGVPMAGVPYHAVEGYLRRMIQAGHRVAVCEQVEDPRKAKGVVKRDVTRVITPGTLTDEHLLNEGEENPLAAVMFTGPRTHPGAHPGSHPRNISSPAGSHTDKAQPKRKNEPADQESVALAWVELSVGAFHVAWLDAEEARDELARIRPRELIYCETATGDVPPRVKALADALDCAITGRPTWQFRLGEAVEILKRQYQVAQLTGFGFEHDDMTLAPAGAIVHYLLETQCVGSGRQANDRADSHEPDDADDELNAGSTATATATTTQPATKNRGTLLHLQPPRRFERQDHLVIDQVSLRSLEVERTLRSNSTEGSLLGVMQGCVTAMGKRLLRHWLCYPLADRAQIEQRQRVVDVLLADTRLLGELRDALDQVQDVPRIAARLAVNRAMPRDLVALGQSAVQAGTLARLLADTPSVKPYHEQLQAIAETLATLAEQLQEACVDSPPNHLREGGLIRDGYDQQLDEYRTLQRDSNDWLARYQKQLIEQTGIPSLKVGYNKVFGYYIEVTAANRDKVADEWIRKQTLKNAERFITPALKTFEEKVLSAESRAISREQDLFARLCADVQKHLPALHAFAQTAAALDVLACFARRAARRRYVKPRIVDQPVLDIQAGRHPVLEELLGDQFVPNDVQLGSRVSGLGPDQETPAADAKPENRDASPAASLALITGPNMAGKSTYIRQSALITLLAHTGSFVPAQQATIGLCDRIFTRIGASDELHAGQSTFMVEMTETANICHHATARSLVILDEIGRGTSTLDGLSLAWAIAEYMAQCGPRCLFATHYHELTALAERFDNVANLNVTVREWQDQIVFLHRIVPGATDRSYGIHVAKIAGLPRAVVDRANALLGELSVSHNAATALPDQVSDQPPDTPTASIPRKREKAADQLSLFTEFVHHPVMDDLKQIDLNTLTPMQAFDLLRQLQRKLTDDQA